MIVLILLAAVWSVVLLPPALRNRRDARPDNSVVSFRAQLSRLERATPGTSLRPPRTVTASGYAGSSVGMTRADVQRRRREVLVGLGGATAFFLLLAIALGGIAIVAFLASAGALGAYVYALVQLKARAPERRAKVRVLMPAAGPAQQSLALRRRVAN